jgi:hypothetical protein
MQGPQTQEQRQQSAVHLREKTMQSPRYRERWERHDRVVRLPYPGECGVGEMDVEETE